MKYLRYFPDNQTVGGGVEVHLPNVAYLEDKNVLFMNSDPRTIMLTYNNETDEISAEFDNENSSCYKRSTESGEHFINELQGRSEKWNQITEPKIAGGIRGVTTEYDESNNTYRYHGTATATESVYLTKMFSVSAEHKYLISYPHTLTSGEKPYGESIGLVRHMLNEIIGDSILYYIPWNKNYAIFSTAENDNSVKIGVAANSGTTFDVTLRAFNLFDLTDIYGAGNEPTTVEQFEADVFAKYGKTLDEYFEYDAGSINNANVEKLDITGFNQWDEEWERGSYNRSTGEKVASFSQIRSTNKIPAFPSTTYYVQCPSNKAMQILCYDANGELIMGWNAGYNFVGANEPRTFTTPAGTRMMAFHINDTTYNHDICINISDPTKNGTYEPYRHAELPINIKTVTGKVNGEGESVTIFPNGMRGVGSAYDSLIVDEDGWARKAIIRISSMDLGRQNWTLDSRFTNNQFYTSVAKMLPSTNIICSNYATAPMAGWAQNVDKTVTAAGSSSYIIVVDSAYTNIADFKAAMQGVELIYELATPIEYVLDEPIKMVYSSYRGGTESMVLENNCLSPLIKETIRFK